MIIIDLIKKSYLNGIYKNYNYLQCLIEAVYYLNYKVCARKKKKDRYFSTNFMTQSHLN